MSSETEIRQYTRPYRRRYSGRNYHYTYWPNPGQLWRVYAKNPHKRMTQVWSVTGEESLARYVKAWNLTLVIPKYLRVDVGL